MITVNGIKLYQFDELSKTAKINAIAAEVNFLKSVSKNYIINKKNIVDTILNFKTWFYESGAEAKAFNVKIENADKTEINYILMDNNLYYKKQNGSCFKI